MAYRLGNINERKIWWPVAVAVVEDEGGKAAEESVELLIQLFTRSQMIDAGASPNALATMMEKMGLTSEADLLVKQIHGWRGVVDEQGKDIPYSENALRQALEDPYFFQACAVGLVKASAAAPRKNS